MVLLKRFTFIIKLLVATYKEIRNEIVVESVEHVKQGRSVAVSPLLLSFIKILVIWIYLLPTQLFNFSKCLWISLA